MVLISEVNANMNDVTVEGTVIEVEEPRTVNTRFGPKQVATATIEDKSGRINLSLWEDQIEKVKNAKKVKIENGYVTEWNDQLQLNVGRRGKLTVE